MSQSTNVLDVSRNASPKGQDESGFIKKVVFGSTVYIPRNKVKKTRKKSAHGNSPNTSKLNESMRVTATE